jgi:hypothetical protein
MQSAWCTLLQDIELMPQYQDFGFQPPPRLEAVAQHVEEKEGNCNHATIVPDSLLTRVKGTEFSEVTTPAHKITRRRILTATSPDESYFNIT